MGQITNGRRSLLNSFQHRPPFIKPKGYQRADLLQSCSIITVLGAVPAYSFPNLSLIYVLTHPMSVDGHFRSL